MTMPSDRTMLPDLSDPCLHCHRYTCRCSEVEQRRGMSAQVRRRLPAEPTSGWTPWMSGLAANA